MQDLATPAFGNMRPGKGRGRRYLSLIWQRCYKQ